MIWIGSRVVMNLLAWSDGLLFRLLRYDWPRCFFCWEVLRALLRECFDFVLCFDLERTLLYCISSFSAARLLTSLGNCTDFFIPTFSFSLSSRLDLRIVPARFGRSYCPTTLPIRYSSSLFPVVTGLCGKTVNKMSVTSANKKFLMA